MMWSQSMSACAMEQVNIVAVTACAWQKYRLTNLATLRKLKPKAKEKQNPILHRLSLSGYQEECVLIQLHHFLPSQAFIICLESGEVNLEASGAYVSTFNP